MKGSIIKNTARGLAIKDKNSVIKRAGTSISGILRGKDKNPIKKNIKTCARAVIPSKKYIRLTLFLISLFPSIIPVMYTLKYPLPPDKSAIEKEAIV